MIAWRYRAARARNAAAADDRRRWTGSARRLRDSDGAARAQGDKLRRKKRGQ